MCNSYLTIAISMYVATVHQTCVSTALSPILRSAGIEYALHAFMSCHDSCKI